MLPLGFSIIAVVVFLGFLASTLMWLQSLQVSAQAGGAPAVAQFYRDGVVGNDVKGAGIVDIPDAQDWKPTTAMTIELWAKPRQTYSASQGTVPHLLSKQGPGYTGYSILYEDRRTAGTGNGRLKGCIGLGARWECASATALPQADFTSGSWYHIVMVKSSGASGRLQLYLNGARVGDEPSTAAISRGTSFLRIGGYSLSTMYAFNGDLDEVRIYSSALSEIEINNHYIKERSTIGAVGNAHVPIRCDRGSAFSADYECQKANPAVAGEWATRRNANPWIRQMFLPAVTVGRIVFKDRTNTTDNVLRGTVELSDGERIPFTRFDPTGSGFLIPLTRVKRNVSSVKVIIEGQEGSNVGLADMAVYQTLPGAATSETLSEADLLAIASDGNVSGFSRSEGCKEGETPPCGGQAYYGWIWMNCLNSIDNEGTPVDYCPTDPITSQKVQARVLVCPIDDRGRTPSRYASVPQGSRLRDCVGKNQGDVVGFAWGGGLGE